MSRCDKLQSDQTGVLWAADSEYPLNLYFLFFCLLRGHREERAWFIDPHLKLSDLQDVCLLSVTRLLNTWYFKPGQSVWLKCNPWSPQVAARAEMAFQSASIWWGQCIIQSISFFENYSQTREPFCLRSEPHSRGVTWHLVLAVGYFPTCLPNLLPVRLTCCFPVKRMFNLSLRLLV